MSSASTEEQQADAYLERATTLLDLGRHKEAIPLIAQSMRLNPNKVETYCHFALALRCGGQRKEALAVLGDAIKLAPNNEWPFRLRSINFQELGDNNAALRDAREAYRLDVEAWQTTYTLGDVLLASRLLDEADEIAQTLKRIAPNNPLTFTLLGRIALERRQLIEAEIHFREALRLDPQNVYAHNHLGTTLMQQGRIDEAVKFFDSGLTIDPTAQHGRSNLYAGALVLRRRSLLSTGKSALLRISPKAYQYFMHRQERSTTVFFFVFLWRFLAPLAGLTWLVAQGARLLRLQIDTTLYVVAHLAICVLTWVTVRFGGFGEKYFTPSALEVKFVSTLTTWLFSPYPLLIYGLTGLLLDPDGGILYMLAMIAGMVFFVRRMVHRARGVYYSLLSKAYPWRLRVRTKREQFFSNTAIGRWLLHAWKFVSHPALYCSIGVTGLAVGGTEYGESWLIVICVTLPLVMLRISRDLTAKAKRDRARGKSASAHEVPTDRSVLDD